jgi:hypothetical protein
MKGQGHAGERDRKEGDSTPRLHMGWRSLKSMVDPKKSHAQAAFETSRKL